MSWPINPRFNIFNDPPQMEGSSSYGHDSKRSGGHCRHNSGGRSNGHFDSNGCGGERTGQKGLPPPTYSEVCAIHDISLAHRVLAPSIRMHSVIWIYSEVTTVNGLLLNRVRRS